MDSVAPSRPTARFMLRHPAHWVALGFGSGLAPKAPGTVGTLWGWVSFLVLDRWLGSAGWARLCPWLQVKWSKARSLKTTGWPSASSSRRPAAASMRPMGVTATPARSPAARTASSCPAGAVKSSS